MGGAEGGLRASASAGIQGALPGQGQRLIPKLVQGVLEEDTGESGEDTPSRPSQRLRREPGPQLRAEVMGPDPSSALLVLRPTHSDQQTMRRDLSSLRRCLSSQDGPGLPRVAPKAPGPLSFLKVPLCPTSRGGCLPRRPRRYCPSIANKSQMLQTQGHPLPSLSRDASWLCSESFPESPHPPTRTSFRDSSALTRHPRGAGDESPPASHGPCCL